MSERGEALRARDESRSFNLVWPPSAQTRAEGSASCPDKALIAWRRPKAMYRFSDAMRLVKRDYP